MHGNVLFFKRACIPWKSRVAFAKQACLRGPTNGNTEKTKGS
jgi:hypothetical protein